MHILYGFWDLDSQIRVDFHSIPSPYITSDFSSTPATSIEWEHNVIAHGERLGLVSEANFWPLILFWPVCRQKNRVPDGCKEPIVSVPVMRFHLVVNAVELIVANDVPKRPKIDAGARV